MRAPATCRRIYEIFDKENTADESRRVADVILRGGDFGRPMIVAPGTPHGPGEYTSRGVRQIYE